MNTQKVSVGGFVLRKDRKFLLVKRSEKDDYMPGLWELAGGGSEHGETPEAACARELKEEVGIDIEVKVPITTTQYFTGETHVVEIIFLCIPVTEDVNLSDEHDDFAWVSVDELEKYRLDDFMKKIITACTADLDYWVSKYF